MQHGSGHNHKQCSRYPFTGNVANGHGEVILIHQIKIVKIPANLFGCLHGSVNIKFRFIRKGRKGFGQHPFLDMPGNRQLSRDAFLFRSHFGKVRNMGFKRCGHVIHTVRKLFYLISGLQGQRFVQIALSNLLHSILQLQDRLYKPLCRPGTETDKSGQQQRHSHSQHCCIACKLAPQHCPEIFHPAAHFTLRLHCRRQRFFFFH